MSYLKHDFHICSTVSEKWRHRLSFPRIVLGGLDSRNYIVYLVDLLKSLDPNWTLFQSLYCFWWSIIRRIENNQDSEVLIMQICSTSGLHVDSTWQGLWITPRVQVLKYMRGKFPSWTWTRLFGLGFVKFAKCSCFELGLKSRCSALSRQVSWFHPYRKWFSE